MKKIKIGTDCSGIEAPIQALINLQIPFEHIFSSEIEPNCIKSINANYRPNILFSDITSRDIRAVPDIDLYVCGFPCQPFSSLGKRDGAADERGTVFYSCLKVLRKKKPKYFVLENVRGILSIHGGLFFRKIIQLLSRGYRVSWNLLNTKDYGIPQSRPRVYIVGIREDLDISFKWPEKRDCTPLSHFIDRYDNHTEEPPKKLEKVRNLPKRSVFIDIGYVNTSFPNSDRFCPCIIANSKIWCVPMKRTANMRELLALQGFPVDFKQVVSDTQMKKQIGNSMSVCVLEAIFSSLLTSEH